MFFRTKMSNLITKDEDINTTPVYIGYLVLKIIKRSGSDRVSIYELTEKLKKELRVIHYRQIILSLSFLHTVGVIDFSEPYIYKI